MAAAGQQWINELWYGGRTSPLSLILVPLSWLFRFVAWLRRRLFDWGLFRRTTIDLPVVVVGNITVGGTGKTPVTIRLVQALADRGIRAGVVSRGYHGFAGESPLPVLSHSDPGEVGDEPVLIAARCHCPVVVHPDRVAAARLLEQQDVDVVIADDGLQHYALARDLELAVVDGRRYFGNGRLLPAGPLREPVGRLSEVSRVLVNTPSMGSPADRLGVGATAFHLEPSKAVPLHGGQSRALGDFAGSRVHAVAAIGNPERFFDTLASFGIEVIPHPMPDHASLHPADLVFADGLPVFVTEKDAVKCRQLDIGNLWVVPVDAVFDSEDWIEDVARMVRAAQEGEGRGR